MPRSLPKAASDPAPVLTKATVRAALALGLSQGELARVLGVSEATASRMRHGRYQVKPEPAKEWEAAALLIRLYRSLLAIVGSVEAAGVWLRGENTALNGRPIDLIRGIEGLVRVVHYLDAYRGRV